MAISDKNIRITTNKNKATGYPNIVFTGSSAGTSVLTLEVRDDNTVAFTGLDGDVFSLDYNLSTGTIWSVNDKSGTPFLRASAGGTIGIAELGSGVLLGVGQSLPQYKLDVKGWAGFASSGDNSYTVLIENGASVGNNALSIRSANALRLYNSGNTFYTGFIGNQSGVNTTYTLPPTSPAVGTSVLQSTTGGIMTWVAMTSGSSSGAVNVANASSGNTNLFLSGTNDYVGSGFAVSAVTSLSYNTLASVLSSTGITATNIRFQNISLPIGGNNFNIYATDGTTQLFGINTSNGWLRSYQTTNSSSTATGALVSSGGLGVANNAFIGGTTVITSNQASVSTTSGALSVSGGMGLVGNAFIGGTLSVLNNTASISSNSGALVVSGGFGLAGNAFIGGTIYVPSTSRSNIGSLVVSDNTSSTSTSTGSLLAAGGLGLAGNAFIGGTVNITNATNSSSTSSGALVVNGGFAATGDVYISSTNNSRLNIMQSNGDEGGEIFFNKAVTNTSLTTGVVIDIYQNRMRFWEAGGTNRGFYLDISTGGASVATNIMGGSSSGTVNSGTATYAAFYGATGNAVSENANLQFTGSGVSIGGNIQSASTATGSLRVTGGLGVTGNAFIGGTVSITNNTTSISSNSGALVVTGGLGVGGNAFIGGTIYVPSTSRSNIGSLVVSDNTSSTSTSTGAFLVTGGLGLAGNAFIGGTLVQTNNTSSIGTNSGSATFAGGVGIAGNAFIGGTVSITNNTASISSNSGALVVTNGFGLGGNAFIGGTIYVPSTSRSNIGSLVVSDSTSSTSTVTGSFIASGGFGLAGNAFIGGTVNVLSTSATASSNSGALVVTGGAAFGQSISVGGRVNLFNGALYTAFLSAQSGVNTTYTLPPTSPSSIGASFLTSSQSGVLAWIAAPSGGSGSPAGTNNGDIQYKFGSSFAAATTLNYDDNTGQLSVSSFPLSAVSSNSAALKLLGTSQSWSSGSTLGTFLAINAAVGFVGDLMNAQVNSASVFQLTGAGYLRIGPVGTGFTLPITNGTAGQVLTANVGGVASWTTVSSSGAGSGTVAIPGAQYQIAAYYSGTGASVSGSSTFTNNTSTGVVNITHTTPSSSTSTGALVVNGSVGIGGSAYIGGQINQTFQPTIGAAIDHAIFLQSNPVQTAVGALIQIGSATKWDGSTAGFFNGTPGGTYLGINAASGNTADLLNFSENGVSIFSVGAGGTDVNFGPVLDYAAPNLLASFKSTVNSYNQVIIQNKSNGPAASANLILNNDQSTDAVFFGELGINSSTFSGSGALAAPNATYVAATSGPLVLGTTTQHPIRFTVNGGATDVMYIAESGTAISVFTNLGMRTASDLRFWNTTNTQYGAIQGGNYTGTYVLTMPTAAVGTGFSSLIVGADGQMYFVSPGSGIAFSTVTGNLPILRSKAHYNLVFCSGFTPTAAGPDNAILRIPESPTDGTTSLTYNIRRFQVRVETPSAGSSRLQLEKSSTDTGAFTLAATGSSFIGGLGVTISGAGIYLTSVTSFAGSLITSGNLMRLNWTLLNATHANYSINLLLEEV